MSNKGEDIFDNFIKLKRGYDLPNHNIVPGDYPIIASTAIKDYHKAYKVNPPGVVTGRSGSLGTVQYVTEKYWPLNTTLYVKNFKGNFRRYVYYFLKTMHLENFNSGAGVPTLNQNHLHKLKIKIPPLPIQEKIAAVLAAYDDLIENNKRRIALLEKMAEEIYHEWFVRMRFPGHEKVKFKKGVPGGWAIDCLDSLGTVVTGKTPSTKIPRYYGEPYLFIKTPDMHNNIFIFETGEKLTEEGIKSQSAQSIPGNSICVSCIGTGGVVSITTEICQTNQQINTVILNDQLDLEWAYFTIRNLKETIKLFGATGTTMTNLSKGKFASLKILLPNKKLRNSFHNKIHPAFSQIRAILRSTNLLMKYRGLLLGRLISGRLSVKTLDIRFPPSMKNEQDAAHA